MTYTPWQRTEHIREIQEYLRTLALVDNNYVEIAVDGIYSTETVEAVRSFQLMNGLPVTGTVDHITWDRLAQDYRDALTLLSEAVPLKAFPAPQRIYRCKQVLREKGHSILKGFRFHTNPSFCK